MASSADAKCTLIFSSPSRGERLVLRSEAPPEAEYAMFDIGDIELRASEPGRVREHGYQTVASKARTRLANAGMSAAAARDVAHAMQPLLTETYARGAAAKKVARYLEPSEILRADGYDPATHLYHGVFLDLAALARDLELEHAAATLQALYLASLLEHEDDDTEVIIHTDECTKGGKPGTRTYKRPSFTEMQRLMNALGGLAHRHPTPELGEVMPKSAVIDFLRARQDSAPDDDARALFRSLETSLSTREMPEKGPLALPDLWDIEERIEGNNFEGTLDMIDEAERRHGRTPGTTYLRARISLELRLEPPKLIAERVSALALSMTNFSELELLAAEAWLEAGDPRRAMPYARDLLAARHVDEGLLIKAKTLLERAESNKPRRRMSPTLVDAVRPAPKRRDSPDSEPPTPVPVLQATPAEPEALGHGMGVGIEDLVLEAESPAPAPASSRPSRGVPPPLPSSRAMRAAPPVPSSSRMPAAAPIPLGLELGPAPTRPPSAPSPERVQASASRASGSSPTMDDIAVPDIPTEPTIPSERASSFPALRSQRPAAAELSPGQSMPPPLELDLAPADPAASFTLDLPGPDAAPEPAPMSAPAPSRRRMSGMVMETRPPASYDPRAEPDSEIVPRTAGAPEIRSAPPPREKMRSSPAPARRSLQPDGEPLPGPTEPSARPGPAIPSVPPATAEPSVRPGPAIPSMPPLPLPTEPSVRPGPAIPSVPPASFGSSMRPGPAEPAPFDDDPFGELEPPPSNPADLDEPTPPRLDAPAPRLDAPPPPLVPSLDDLRTQPNLPPLADGELSPLSVHAAPTTPPEALPSRVYMRGASMPPYQKEVPAPLLPKAPLLPRLTGDELAEHLSLPPGVGGEARSLETLPTSVLEARVQFTLLSRELGLDYRLKRGIELRVDETGIEAMQAVLAEMFPDRVVHTRDDAYEVRRHGAFLSEILARRLDAEWMDISPSELGHWVMIVPPDTRIWPFGRVSRLISMGQRERDLVSYFFELSARSRPR